jgi:nucleotidyltransferase substrate binding protein (TIGR01987 family)
VERLEQRLEMARRALTTFHELSDLTSPTTVERDAAIQRFEYTFEAVWKAAQRFLHVREGRAEGSPKGVIRGCREVGLMSDADTTAALAMADDRNLTVHTYNEALAIALYGRFGGHAALFDRWLAGLSTGSPP